MDADVTRIGNTKYDHTWLCLSFSSHSWAEYAFHSRISNHIFCVVWFSHGWMAVPFTTAKTNNYVKGQQSRWRGGPRLPAAARRQRARSSDDLEDEWPLNVSSNRFFITAILTEHLNTRESSTRVPVNRASLVAGHWIQRPRSGDYSYSESKPHPSGPTLVDTCWQLYGPRQPHWKPLNQSVDNSLSLHSLNGSRFSRYTWTVNSRWQILRRNLSKVMPTTTFHPVDWNSWSPHIFCHHRRSHRNWDQWWCWRNISSSASTCGFPPVAVSSRW